MKINIIRQNALKYRRAQRIRLINSLVTFGSLALFGLAVLWVSGQYVYYAFRSNSLTTEVNQLKSLYSGRADVVASYLAVKQIISRVTEIQTKRFKYREFLDEVFKLIPPNATLSEVSFGVKGVILVSIRLPSLNDYDTLMANLNTASAEPDFLFGSVAEKGLSREKAGGYLVTMELTIK
jgi:hypothetical protein